MKIYWRLNSIPELQSLPQPLRAIVWKKAVRRAMREKRLQAMFALCGSLVIVVAFMSSLFEHKALTIAAISVSILAATLVYGYSLQRSAIPYLKHLLSEPDDQSWH